MLPNGIQASSTLSLGGPHKNQLYAGEFLFFVLKNTKKRVTLEAN